MVRHLPIKALLPLDRTKTISPSFRRYSAEGGVFNSISAILSTQVIVASDLKSPTPRHFKAVPDSPFVKFIPFLNEPYSNKEKTFHPFGFSTGSPNISKNVASKKTSASLMACSRFWRMSSALSRISAIRFCSSNGGNGISKFSTTFLDTSLKVAPLPNSSNCGTNFLIQ
ncbi:hypothetical protein BvCmsJ49A_01219 [Escherichia coli]|nr:hypothetical protein BvCmsJ49A_01219 [Escherichia coli]